MNRLVKICDDHNILLIEDAAESLGSKYDGKHSGTFGKIGCFSFNGNKIITCGGGGMICLLYTSPSPRDGLLSRMPSSA